MTDRERIVRTMAEGIGSVRWSESVPHTFFDEDLAGAALAALEAAGYAIHQRTGWEVSCPQCEEAGEVTPHDADTDCDLCVRGEFDGHAVDCPTCLGRGVVGVVPVGGDTK